MHELFILVNITRRSGELKCFVALIHNVSELFVKFILKVDA